MKQIPLTKGKYAVVDDEDFEYLNQWKWYCNAQGYAVREVRTGTKSSRVLRKTVRMHRLLNKTPKGFDTDHIDRNSLNNQKSNLRTVTHAKNMFNLGTPRHNTSGFKGVCWSKVTNKWRAYIQVKRRQINLGLYGSLEEAVVARRKAEEVYHAI